MERNLKNNLEEKERKKEKKKEKTISFPGLTIFDEKSSFFSFFEPKIQTCPFDIRRLRKAKILIDF